MRGERDLARLLAGLRPELAAEPYVVVSVAPDAVPAGLAAFATVREEEGLTLVLPAAVAEAAGLAPGFEAARITLRVHSDLAAVGLTAAVSARLAAAGIACNVVAGAFHDHLLVPWARREEAHALLSSVPARPPGSGEDAPMRSRVVPPEGLSSLTGSVVAALAWILGVEVAAVAVPPAGHPEPWTVWRGWLGERGLGLVSVPEPATFAWPGPWLVLVPGDDGGQVAAVAFGVPGGLVWQAPGGTATLADAEAGFVVAAADLAAWTAPSRAGRTGGRVEAIALAPAAEAPMAGVTEAVAVAGTGLEGDRYAAGSGTFSDPHAVGIALTLVEGEALDALGLAAPAARRNLVTRGVDLDALIGHRFRVGDVVCVGRRRCEPCAHLERLTAPGVLRGLVHRGGLRADIVAGGTIRVGDTVELLEDAAPPAAP